MIDASKIQSAIDHIKSVWGVAEWAAEIAVDAMEKQIPCEDCVSRKAVIRLLHSGYHSKSMIEEVKELPSAQPDYKTDHGYMWLCPKCGLQVHSDFIKCPRCGLVRHDTQQEIGITRCMYCKNWVPGYITDNDEFIPPKCGKYQQMVGHNHDDFCSLVERKEKCINAEEKAGLQIIIIDFDF